MHTSLAMDSNAQLNNFPSDSLPWEHRPWKLGCCIWAGALTRASQTHQGPQAPVPTKRAAVVWLARYIRSRRGGTWYRRKATATGSLFLTFDLSRTNMERVDGIKISLNPPPSLSYRCEDWDRDGWFLLRALCDLEAAPTHLSPPPPRGRCENCSSCLNEGSPKDARGGPGAQGHASVHSGSSQAL